MSLRLQFGSGPHKLPDPWQNLDVEHDIRKPLKFKNESVRYILAEHVIEHVGFHQGLFFLQECYRVLEVGGVLRIGFPDVVRVSQWPKKWAEAYLVHSKAPEGAELPTPARVTMLLSAGWSHQMAWTEGLMFLELLAVGFRRVAPQEYGKSQYSDLEGIDGHHKSVGMEMCILETSVIEATK